MIKICLLSKKYAIVKNIHLHVEMDETVEPVAFQIPPDVINGTANASTFQFFTTVSKKFDVESGLRAISECTINKEFQIPNEAAGHFLVVKVTPMSEDGECGEPRYAISEKPIEDSVPPKPTKYRGRNRNKKIASLKRGQKLEINFYNNRAVGDNHECWSRHLGRIARDKNMCPVQVKSWKALADINKDHMWDSVKGMDAKDWEWLVTNKFLTDKFQKSSEQNTKNRGFGFMPHRSGSKPHRQIIYDMGGRDNNPPDVAQIFRSTRQKNGKFVEPEEQDKYDEIFKTVQDNASLSHIEVVEKCFGPQRHSNVFGFGGGMKRKHFDGCKSAYVKDLEGKLHEKEEENNALKKRVDAFENRLIQVEKVNQATPVSPPLAANN